MRALLLAIVVGLAGAQPAASETHEFASPTRNISCVMDAKGARCDIREKAWTVARPATCRYDYGQGLGVDRGSRRGYVVCAGDTALGASRVLRYGRTIREGGMRCTSRRSGMTCSNARGHGFTLSRTRKDLF